MRTKTRRNWCVFSTSYSEMKTDQDEEVCHYFTEPVQAWLRAYEASMLISGDCVASVRVADATENTLRPDDYNFIYIMRKAALAAYSEAMATGRTPGEARSAYDAIFTPVMGYRLTRML